MNASLVTIIVYEKSCPYDDFDTENGGGMPDDAEANRVDSAEIGTDDLADDGYFSRVSLDDAIQSVLDDFGCGQWDGGNTGYDPDGTDMAFDAAGTITERWCHIIRTGSSV